MFRRLTWAAVTCRGVRLGVSDGAVGTNDQFGWQADREHCIEVTDDSSPLDELVPPHNARHGNECPHAGIPSLTRMLRAARHLAR